MKIWIYILLQFFTLMSCKFKTSTKSFVLKELSKDTTFQFIVNNESITTLQLNVKGEVNDTCSVSGLILAAGKIDTLWSTDWYNKKVIVPYKSLKANKGSLYIECKIL